MTPLELSSKDRRFLETFTAGTNGAKELRRALALLWLDEGDTVPEVSERLRVSRQTVYNWVSRFESRDGLNVAEHLADGERPGRPRTVQGLIDPLIEQVLDTDPQALGYRATVWTAAMLKQYLDEVRHMGVSRRSIGGALRRLHIRWKRPRHQLALRPATWRQSKGGLNGGSTSGSARSS